MIMDGFTRTEIETSGARIVVAHGGSGPPLLLLHGNPFTHLSWHKFAPRLAQEFKGAQQAMTIGGIGMDITVIIKGQQIG